MAHLDSRTGEVVIRVVYDGAPRAGKTTNVRMLHESLLAQRAGELVSPGSSDRQTQFFDWRDFDGGFVEGRRLRCQILSVPGQPDLAHRRRHLLATADVVILVVDADPAELDRSRAIVRSLSATLGDAQVPLVVQLNKLDLGGPLTVADVAATLRLPESTPALGAEACHGIGVADTFLTAVRLALDGVRPRLVQGSLVSRDSPTNAAELHASMRHLG